MAGITRFTDPVPDPVPIIDVSEHRPRRPPSLKWRELIERILRHLGLWEEPDRLNPARAPPAGEGMVELFPGDPFPDYSMDPVMDYDLCADG